LLTRTLHTRANQENGNGGGRRNGEWANLWRGSVPDSIGVRRPFLIQCLRVTRILEERNAPVRPWRVVILFVITAAFGTTSLKATARQREE
jgi:hypothetical protein